MPVPCYPKIRGKEWKEWEQLITISTASASTCTIDTWGQWVSDSITVSSSDIWNTWISTLSSTLSAGFIIQEGDLICGAPDISEEARAAQELERQQRVSAARQERLRIEAALNRAEQLLVSYLTPEQKEQFLRQRKFVAESRGSKRRFEIECNGAVGGNVYELDGRGRRINRYCCHIPNNLKCPSPDHYLTQKLMLEHIPEEFLEKANRTPLVAN